MKRIPNSNHITDRICERFSGYLQVDAKYVSVRPHERKMAFIWAIDYYTHDIVWWNLVPEENFDGYYWMFEGLRRAGYQLKCLICDDHKSIHQAVFRVYGTPTNIQLCLVHFKRNIQKRLDLRINQRDQKFFEDIKYVFNSRNEKVFHGRGKTVLKRYHDNQRYVEILAEIDSRFEQLTTYLRYRKCPSTNNLIEGYNKHLATRLKGLDGFKHYETAVLWLNSYVMWRRTTPFKSCKGKFKELNGKVSLGETAGINAPEIYFLRDEF